MHFSEASVTLVLKRIHFFITAKPVKAESKAALHFSCAHMRKKQNYSGV